MIFAIEIGGQRRAVELRRAGTRWVVAIDGRDVEVDAVRAGGRWSLLIGTSSHEVAIDDRGAGALVVVVDGQAVPVSLASRRRAGAGNGRAAGPALITAPMPGRIVRVLVKAGDVVAARQGLVVVEAMKMENELRAPAAGTVTEVRVTEGMLVEANAVLVTVE